MAMFNSHVKLPEGINGVLSCFSWEHHGTMEPGGFASHGTDEGKQKPRIISWAHGHPICIGYGSTRSTRSTSIQNLLSTFFDDPSPSEWLPNTVGG
jgi:hypothetical protein